MIRLVRVRLLVCVLVSVMPIGGGAFAQSADNLRRIVTFQNLDLTTTLGYLTAVSVVTANGTNGIKVVPPKLEFISALVIQLPAAGISLPASVYISDISPDPLGRVDPITPCLAPTAEDYGWGLERIEAPKAHQHWPPNATGAGVRVAILDTGIDSDHPDLSPYVDIESGYNALPAGGPPQDNNGHGTHMAGIIGALLNGQGIKGGGPPHPRAILVPVKVLDQSGFGYLSYFLDGMQFVYRTDIQLVNMSFGFDDYPALKKATQRLYERGVIMVAAAGCKPGKHDEGGGEDGGCDTATVYDPTQIHGVYPAGYDWTIAVGAIDYDNQVADYSGSGPWLDVVASGGSLKKGIRILSTTPGGGYGCASGTSQAAAAVSATCALALQLKQKLSFEQVRSVLQTTATKLINPSTGKAYPPERQGAGLINADKVDEAVKALK
jgi:subtilisin family serine protease